MASRGSRRAGSRSPTTSSSGPDVVIEAEEVEIGPGARIGMSGDDDFRTPPGVLIRAKRVAFGPGVGIGRAVRIEGGSIRLDEGVRILRHSTVKVLDELRIGAYGTVNESCEIGGRRITIGQELWMLPTAKIGGGSAYELPSRLEIGHYVHLGVQTLVNTARPVTIGHEVGLGTRTSIYTHGAYPSRLQGFPVAFDGVEIGDFAWLPGAIDQSRRTDRPELRRRRELARDVEPAGWQPGGRLAGQGDQGERLPAAVQRGATRPVLRRIPGAIRRVLLGSDAGVDDGGEGAALLDTGPVVFAGIAADDAGPVAEGLAGGGGLDDRRVVVIGEGVGAAELPAGWTALDPVLGGSAARPMRQASGSSTSSAATGSGSIRGRAAMPTSTGTSSRRRSPGRRKGRASARAIGRRSRPAAS